jgi:hypothetical protein
LPFQQELPTGRSSNAWGRNMALCCSDGCQLRSLHDQSPSRRRAFRAR